MKYESVEELTAKQANDQLQALQKIISENFFRLDEAVTDHNIDSAVICERDEDGKISLTFSKTASEAVLRKPSQGGVALNSLIGEDLYCEESYDDQGALVWKIEDRDNIDHQTVQTKMASNALGEYLNNLSNPKRNQSFVDNFSAESFVNLCVDPELAKVAMAQVGFDAVNQYDASIVDECFEQFEALLAVFNEEYSDQFSIDILNEMTPFQAERDNIMNDANRRSTEVYQLINERLEPLGVKR